MKRGIVMEIKRKRVIVMTNDGQFKEILIPNRKGLSIGEEVDVPDSQASSHLNWVKPLFPVIAVAVMFIFLVNQFAFQQKDVAAFVSIDINPSIEASIDENLEVLDLHGLNKDGEKIIEDLESYKQQPLSVVIDNIVVKSNDQGYLKQNHDIVVATTVLDETKEAKIQSQVKSEVDKLAQKKADKAVSFETLKSDQSTRKVAQETGVSTGKYLVYLDAAKVDQSITQAEARALSITELKERKNQKGNKEKNKDKDKDVNSHEDNKQTKQEHVNQPKKQEEKNNKKEEKKPKDNPGQNKKDNPNNTVNKDKKDSQPKNNENKQKNKGSSDQEKQGNHYGDEKKEKVDPEKQGNPHEDKNRVKSNPKKQDNNQEDKHRNNDHPANNKKDKDVGAKQNKNPHEDKGQKGNPEKEPQGKNK